MSYIAHDQGPRLSEILSNLGAEYFGITSEQLMQDIEEAQESEARGKINPARIDEAGRLCYVLRTKQGNKTHYFRQEELEKICQGETIKIKRLRCKQQ